MKIFRKMILPWLMVTVVSLLFLAARFMAPKKWRLMASIRKWRLIAAEGFKFIFLTKSEDRHNAFKHIHKVFPRYCRIKIFNFDNIFVYDPELSKKIFNAQSACQRPFRNCLQLEMGLLSSECEFLKRNGC